MNDNLSFQNNHPSNMHHNIAVINNILFLKILLLVCKIINISF